MVWSSLCCVLILCVSSSLQSEGHVDGGRCVFSPPAPPLCPPPLIFPLSVTCECVESWGKGEESTSLRTSKLWAPPQASGL